MNIYPPVEDDYEPDNWPSSAVSIADGETQNHSINTLRDEDWAAFNITQAGSSVVARTGPKSGFNGGNTMLRLYGPNSSTQEIVYNDDFNGLWSRVSAANLGEGTYYLKAYASYPEAPIDGYTLYLDIIPPGGDDYEPDDTPGAARPIADGETQHHSIRAGSDEDWAVFTINWSGSSILARTGERVEFSGGDTELWLYGPDSLTESVAYNDDFTALWSQVSATDLAAGIYYLRIREHGTDAPVDGYTLYLDIIPPAWSEHEPDDTPVLARPIADGETHHNSIHTPTDEDWVVFTIDSPGSSVLAQTGGAGESSTEGIELWLYGPNDSTSVVASGVDVHGLWAEVRTGDLEVGAYYLKVRGHGSLATIDGYTLSLNILLPGVDGFEPDSRPEVARFIDDGETQIHNLKTATDEDWVWVWIAAAGSSVVARTGEQTGFPGGDTELWLYGPNDSSTQVAYNNDFNGLWSQVSASNLAAGIYYLRVREHDTNAPIDGYTFYLDIIPPSVITWSNPASIVYGTALGASELNATATPAGGIFSYDPAPGTILGAGAHTLNVTYTPSDTVNYSTSTKAVIINVTKAPSAITWSNPGDIVYGTVLGASELNAMATPAGGIFSYDPAPGTILGAGAHTLNVTFTPSDTVNYSTSTKSVSINVSKAPSIITWSNPASIVYGTALGAAELNATATPAGGLFSYDPALGTILGAGPHTLNVTFTPTDIANYSASTKSVSINVTKTGANDIEPAKEFYNAYPPSVPIVVDGSLTDWTGLPAVENPKFAVPKGSGTAGTYVTFEEYGGGSWTGPADFSFSTQITWDEDNIYVGIVVIDEYHEHASATPWNGDSVQLMIASADREAQAALYNFALTGTETALGEIVNQVEAGPAADAACNCAIQAVIRRNPTSHKTIYEIRLPAGALGFPAPLTPSTQFGLGMAINDGDENSPGQKGWGGWGPHALVFGKSPTETALITLARIPQLDINISRSGGNASVVWGGGLAPVLFTATTLDGPWQPAPGVTSPLTVPLAHSSQFFRLVEGAIVSKIVGFQNVTLAPGYNQLSNPLVSTAAGGNIIKNLFAGLPAGSQIFKYNATTRTFDGAILDDSPFEITGPAADMTLLPGESAIVQTPSPMTLTFIGEALTGTVRTPIPVGISGASSQIARTGRLSNDFGYAPSNGDSIHVFSSANQKYLSYHYANSLGWIPSEPIIQPGQSFWIMTSTLKDWITTFNP